MQRVLENRVLRGFGPKGEKVNGGGRELCNGELCDLYYSPNKDNEMDRACSMHKGDDERKHNRQILESDM
jgi:hypothetical protein